MAAAFGTACQALTRALEDSSESTAPAVVQAIQRVTSAERVAASALLKAESSGFSADDGQSAADRAAFASHLAEKDVALRRLALSLAPRARTLEAAVHEHRARVNGIARAEGPSNSSKAGTGTGVDADLLVQYAGLVRYATFAPRGWQFGMPLVGFGYPSPQEEQIRRGVLWGNSAQALQAAGAVRGEDEEDDSDDDGSNSARGNQSGAGEQGSGTTAVGSAAGIDLSGFAPPPGWKPGMPLNVDLSAVAAAAAAVPKAVPSAAAESAVSPRRRAGASPRKGVAGSPRRGDGQISLDFSDSSDSDSDRDSSDRDDNDTSGVAKRPRLS